MAIRNTAKALSTNPMLLGGAKKMLSQVGEATEKFPGLSTKEVNNLLNLTKDIEDEEEKKATRNELYRAALPIAQNNNRLDERDEILNQKAYEVSQMTDGDQKNAQIVAIKLGGLSNRIKRTYSEQISADADDNEVLNQFIAQIPDGQQLLENYLNNGDETLLYVGGLEKEPEVEEEKSIGEKAVQQAENVVGGVLDSVTGIDKLIGKGLGDVVARTAKKLGADEEKTNALLDDWKNYIGDEGSDIGQDRDSATYKVSNAASDLIQVATAAGGIKKGAAKATETIASKGGNVAKIIQKAGGSLDDLAKTRPALTKIIKGGLQGAGDQILFEAVNGEVADGKDIAVGAAFGAAIPAIGEGVKATKKLIQKGAKSLELNSMLNPAKLEKVKDTLNNIGESTPEDVGEWMIKRGMKGSKKQIINQLDDRAKQSKDLVDEALASSTSVHKVKSANDALKLLYENYSKTPGLESKADDVLQLMNKEKFTLTELNKVKRLMDEGFNMYKNSGGEAAGFKAEGLRTLRGEIKRKIEDVAMEEGLGNIKLLNNETQVARALMEGISKKENADTVRALLSPFAGTTAGGVIGGIAGANTSEDKLKGAIKGVVIGGLLGSTVVKSNIASELGKLSGIKKTTLDEVRNYVASEGATKLSNEGATALGKILSQDNIRRLIESIYANED